MIDTQHTGGSDLEGSSSVRTSLSRNSNPKVCVGGNSVGGYPVSSDPNGRSVLTIKRGHDVSDDWLGLVSVVLKDPFSDFHLPDDLPTEGDGRH